MMSIQVDILESGEADHKQRGMHTQGAIIPRVKQVSQNLILILNFKRGNNGATQLAKLMLASQLE